jgi:hypothetical protein
VFVVLHEVFGALEGLCLVLEDHDFVQLFVAEDAFLEVRLGPQLECAFQTGGFVFAVSHGKVKRFFAANHAFKSHLYFL